MQFSRRNANYLIKNPSDYIESSSGLHHLNYNSYSQEFVMSGPTGMHRLYAPQTSFQRLKAHWLGFTNV